MDAISPKSIIVSRKNQALITPRDGRTVTLMPNGVQFDGLAYDAMLVPHRLRETWVLRNIGYRVPNPMLCYYNWHGGSPFAVQRATCDMLTTNPRAYVLNSMGTGKTKAALWSWDYLNQGGYAGKLLVVATLSNLNFVWAREAFATLPHRKVQVLHGSKKQRLERLGDADADIYVINHDGLRVVEPELLQRLDIDTLVLDELAVYRNNSDRSKSMRKFAQRFKWVWGMTGTPMPNAPTDVWAQARIITPHTVPKFFKHAEEMLMVRKSQYLLVPKPDAVERAFAMLQPSVRYSLDAVVELPEIIHRTVDVPLSKQQDDTYKKVARELQMMVGSEQITALNAAVAMGKLMQIAGGWVYSSSSEKVIALDNKDRVQTVVDLINQAPHKVLVFVPYRHAVEGLSAALDALPSGNKIEHALVHGETPQKERDHIFNLFQNTTKYKAILAHPACCAHGLTLTAADTIIWYLPTTSLEQYDQANARIRRVGQSHRQQIFHLQSTPVERKIYTALRGKARIQDDLLAMLQEATEQRITDA